MSFFRKTTAMFSDKKLKQKTIALAGNPNVGKSTVFNALTGLKQHTGNWPGKTVSNARGSYSDGIYNYTLVDVPGTYSLLANSYEEEIARDFICFGDIDATIVVIDATSLERNLNLVLQIAEVTDNMVVCVNLMDEARKKKINIDLDELSLQLGVPVVGTEARQGKGMKELIAQTSRLFESEKRKFKVRIKYDDRIEYAISELESQLSNIVKGKINTRWLAIKLLDYDETLGNRIREYLGIDVMKVSNISNKLNEVYLYLEENGIKKDEIRDSLVTSVMEKAEGIYKVCVKLENSKYNERDRKIDRVLTSKRFGIPIMLLLLGVVFWITIVGANYPSEIISKALFGIEDVIYELLIKVRIPIAVAKAIVYGMYRTLAWVVSVMLPPMAIFFPLFTLLEDSGYLPRIAFNLDKYFKKACAHGKQALTMCMGFGCNACGVIGCRIIDSPRERLIAVLTNNFVPCNGRFPTLIAIISMFFASSFGVFNSLISALLLTFVISIGIFATLIISKFLSYTVLKGEPSSFTLELPPYRRPQILKVIVRSIFDKTFSVLGRAVVVAIPAGFFIWALANVSVGGTSILAYCTTALDPLAKIMGLDGTILLAFVLGLPANEIVIPVMLMSYMSTGMLTEYESLDALKNILLDNGWTWITALCTMTFSLFHFPCATTLLTIKKETQSVKWTVVAFLLPTVVGTACCVLINLVGNLVL